MLPTASCSHGSPTDHAPYTCKQNVNIPAMRRKTVPIAFRAPEDLLSRIDEERKPFGLSRGDWVRGVITARLFEDKDDPRNAQQTHLAEAVQRLEDEVATLKTNQARLLYIALTCIGDLDPETAQQLIRENLLA